jgi:uncharacterized membrane-anchored protein
MTSARQDDLQRPFRRYLSKAPEVTVFFWVIKILATTVGDACADGFRNILGLGISTMLVLTLVAAMMVVQLSMNRYIPALYWSIVVSMSILGPLVADNLIDIFGVSPNAAAVAFAALLLVTLVVWYATEKTLSIHTIDTAPREAFYWLAVLLTFALGAAMTDFGGEALGLPYGVAAVVFAALIATVWAAHRLLRLAAGCAFWIAYVATYPLGASLGDMLSQPTGPVATSAVFLLTILLIVSYLTISHRDKPSLDAAARQVHARPPW